jgi:uncharacterized delta-60 repeat protein
MNALPRFILWHRILLACCCAVISACGGENPPQLDLPPTPPLTVPPPPPPPTTPTPGLPALETTSIKRSWEFSQVMDVNRNAVSLTGIPAPLDTDGGVVDQKAVLGGLSIQPPQLSDSRAWVEAYSNETGMTYWVGAQAPITQPGSGGAIGGRSKLDQTQYFQKKADDATLRYVVSDLWIELIDGNNANLEPGECPWDSNALVCPDMIAGFLELSINAAADLDNDGTFETSLKRGWGWAAADGMRDVWGAAVAASERIDSLWWWDDLEYVGANGASVLNTESLRFRLKAPIRVEIPLDDVPLEGKFAVRAVATAESYTLRQKESYAAAFLRDPASTGGIVAESDGIEVTEVPVGVGSVVDPPPEPPAVCTSTSSNAGVIEFDIANYNAAELPGAGGLVAVRRHSGTEGYVSALVGTADGSATAGVDYQSTSVRVHFAPGEDLAYMRVPMILDAIEEGSESVSLQLQSPGGCATLGSQINATLTILDDDVPPPVKVSHSVGGNVSGLMGTGLVIEDRAQAISLPITSNGAFLFNREYSAGASYDVRVVSQPANPIQICSITNANGTVTNISITDVMIECVTPAPPKGLDPSFGSGGRAAEGTGAVKAIARQADGKIVTTTATSLSRVSTNGTLDTGFGMSGVVSSLFGNSTSQEAFDVAIQSDGKIVVVGAARPSSATGLGTDYAAARFNADGSRDVSFNGGNTVFVDFIGAPDRASRVLLQPDGRIILAGLATTVYTSSTDDTDFAVVRLSADGALDTSFGNAGRATADMEQLDFGYAAALQSDGKIVVGGRVSINRGDESDTGFARFNANGSLDTTFGTAGTTIIDLSANWDEAVDLVVQPDDRIVAAVSSSNVGDFEFGVLRLNTDGSRDAGFGANGWITRSIGPTDDTPSALAIQSDGRIVVLGTVVTGSLTADYSDIGFARFTSAGAVDTTFASDGAMTVDYFSSRDSGADLLIQSDGKIVGAGAAVESLFSTRAALVRIFP